MCNGTNPCCSPSQRRRLFVVVGDLRDALIVQLQCIYLWFSFYHSPITMHLFYGFHFIIVQLQCIYCMVFRSVRVSTWSKVPTCSPPPSASGTSTSTARPPQTSACRPSRPSCGKSRGPSRASGQTLFLSPLTTTTWRPSCPKHFGKWRLAGHCETPSSLLKFAVKFVYRTLG